MQNILNLISNQGGLKRGQLCTIATSCRPAITYQQYPPNKNIKITMELSP